MAATIIPSSFARQHESANTLSSVTAKYLDAENGKEIAKKQTFSVTHRKVPASQTTPTRIIPKVGCVYSHKDLTYIISYPDRAYTRTVI